MILQSSPGPSNLHDEQLHHDPQVLEEFDIQEILHVGPTTQDVCDYLVQRGYNKDQVEREIDEAQEF